MLIREALAEGLQKLTENLNDRNLNLDTSLLMGHCLGVTREKLYAMLGDELPEKSYPVFMGYIEKRSQGYPLAYITGFKEFYGRNFFLCEGLLCPRPDTEVLLEEGLEWLSKEAFSFTPRVLDLCSGTGCIGLSVACETGSDVLCADISPKAEEYFEINRRALETQARFVRSDLFSSIEGRFHLILTNPPYLTSNETQERMDDRWKEPALALDGGPEGLDLIKVIIDEAPDYLYPGGALMIESDPSQMTYMSRRMEKRGFTELEIIPDLADDNRVIKGVYRG